MNSKKKSFKPKTREWYYENDAGKSENDNCSAIIKPTASDNLDNHDIRSWYYDIDQSKYIDHNDFSELYKKCNGTILWRRDCGIEACKNVSCCYSTGYDSFIFFLPGEYEYQLKQKTPIDFKPISPDHPNRFHCHGNKGCNYAIRPLDCRSYPYFPAIRNTQHIGYYDCRDSHNCPLKPEIELRSHLRVIEKWWSLLLKNTSIMLWAEKMGNHLKTKEIVELPIAKED